MFDLFVRLIRVNLYVRFFVRFHVRFFARYFSPTCSCPIFFWFFDPISCPIFPDFCPIFYVRFSLSDFFVRLVHVRFSLTDSFLFVRFILSDVFMSDFLSYFLCPIFARFDVSSFCPIFCPLFLADLLSHFLCDFSSKKMEHVSSCNATFVMYYQCVSVFMIMTVSYTRMGVI